MNKILYNHPVIFEDNEPQLNTHRYLKKIPCISIDTLGYIYESEIRTAKGYEQAFNCESKFFFGTKINVEDIDNGLLQSTTISGKHNEAWISLKCKERENCIIPKQTLGGEDFYKISWHLTNSNDARRFLNALKYLVSQIKELKYQVKETPDPYDSLVNKELNPSHKGKTPILLKPQNGVFSLSVNLNGVAARFILDSGAGESTISSEFENLLLSKGKIAKRDYLNNGLYQLADGSIVECKRIKIAKVNVGNKTLTNVIVAVTPSGSSNLLGQSFLKRNKSWTIDNSNNYLILE